MTTVGINLGPATRCAVWVWLSLFHTELIFFGDKGSQSEVWAVVEVSLTLCHPVASSLTPQTTLPADEAESGEIPFPGAYLREPPPLPQGTGLPAFSGGGALSLKGAHPQCKSLTSPPPELGGCGSSEARFLACPLGMEQGGRKCYMERCSQHWAHSELQA